MPNPSETLTCSGCGTQVAPSLLSCPSCHRLTHTELLNRLANDAKQCSQQQDLSGALALWRQALDLLPVGSKQHRIISDKVTKLNEQVESHPATSSGTRPGSKFFKMPSGLNGKKMTGIGVLGLLVWKFKFIVVFFLTKAKLLFLGLTKASTLFSMLLSLGVYWAAWGWKFALGIIVSIYIHEMGHVAALRSYGIKASAPMFIPGVGAFVQMHQRPSHPNQDAIVGLAGPWWGLATAAIAYGVSRVMGWPSWAAIAQVGAWITLFNLLPVWQLDGSRGFAALSRTQRWCAVFILGLLWIATQEGLLVLLALVAGYRALATQSSVRGNWATLVNYGTLAVLSAALSRIQVPLP